MLWYGKVVLEAAMKRCWENHRMDDDCFPVPSVIRLCIKQTSSLGGVLGNGGYLFFRHAFGCGEYSVIIIDGDSQISDLAVNHLCSQGDLLSGMIHAFYEQSVLFLKETSYRKVKEGISLQDVNFLKWMVEEEKKWKSYHINSTDGTEDHARRLKAAYYREEWLGVAVPPENQNSDRWDWNLWRQHRLEEFPYMKSFHLYFLYTEARPLTSVC